MTLFHTDSDLRHGRDDKETGIIAAETKRWDRLSEESVMVFNNQPLLLFPWEREEKLPLGRYGGSYLGR